MRYAIRSIIGLVVVGFFAGACQAHFTMLFVQPPSAKKGEAVAVIYEWGHPFEHQLFPKPGVQSVVVLAPDGKRSDLTKTLKSKWKFTPDERGDYVLILRTSPIWMEEEKEFYEDTAKVVLHVQVQKGWDASLGKGIEMTPLTRPYGLLPGAVFQTQVMADGKPVPGALVEIERYNPTPPKELPPDEQITRTAKTDPNGVVTTTLPEPGWWCLAASRDGGKKEREGKSYPVRQRAIFWVHVEQEKIQK